MPTYNLNGFEDVDVSGFKYPDPGVYTLQIDQAPESNYDDKGQEYLTVHYTVIDGPQQKDPDPERGTSPVGMTYQDRVYMTPKAIWRFKALLVATKLLDPKDKTSPMAKGQDINTDLLVGRTLQGSIDVTTNPNTGKEYRNLTFLY